MLENVITGKRASPRRILLYGTHGIGKSTWAAGAPSPIVLQTEDGLNDIGVDRTPVLTKTIDVARWLIELSGEAQHKYQSVVIDTVDWLEKLIWTAVCEEGDKKSIEDFGYGKGYVRALQRWEQLIAYLEACRAKGLHCILVAHARVEKYTPPDADPYDRWSPDIHKTAAACLQEWADEVLFATYKVATVKTPTNFGQARTRAVGEGERLVYTSEQPTHLAKRRIELPDVLPLEFKAYQEHWPSNGQAKRRGNVDGMVKDGSSKKQESK